VTDADAFLRAWHGWSTGSRATGPAARLEAAVDLADAVLAVATAADLLDPDRRLSRWQLAGELEAALSDFAERGYRTIAAGRRGPQNALEAALVRILRCATCPRSQRRLFALLD